MGRAVQIDGTVKNMNGTKRWRVRLPEKEPFRSGCLWDPWLTPLVTVSPVGWRETPNKVDQGREFESGRLRHEDGMRKSSMLEAKKS